jgi:hypothetical protein
MKLKVAFRDFAKAPKKDTTSLDWRVLPIFKEGVRRYYTVARSILTTIRTDTLVKFHKAIVLPVLL